MRYLIGYEIKKITKNRIMLALFALLLLVNGAMAIHSSQKTEHEDALIAFYADYIADADTAAYWRDYYADIEAQNERLEQEWWEQVMAGNKDPMISYDPHLITGSESLTDRELLSRLLEKEQTIIGLPEYYRRIAMQAQDNRDELLGEGYGEHSFAVTMQEQTCERYLDLAAKIEVEFIYPRGWERYFAFSAVDLFILLFLLLTASQIFPTERRLRMEPMLRAAPNGGVWTTVAKLIAMLVITTITVLIFVAEALIIFAVRLGFSPLSCAIQLFDEFRLVPFALSTGEYLVLSVLSKWLAFCAFSACVVFVSVLTHSTVFSFAGGAVIYGASWFFWQFDYVGTPPAFHYINMVSATQFVVPSTRYKLFGVGRVAISTILLTFLLGAILLVGGFLLTVFFQKKRGGRVALGKSVHQRALFSRIAKRLQIRPRVKSRTHMKGVFGFECYKHLVARGRIVLIILLIAVKVITAYSSAKPMLYSELLLKEYTQRFGGELTEQTLLEIGAEQAFVGDIMNGKFPCDDLEESIALYEYAQGREPVINDLAARADRLWEKHEQSGVPVYIVYDHGWELLFTRGPDLLLYAGILLLLCGVFSGEHGKDNANGNLYAMLRSTPKGRAQTFFAKICMAFSVSCLLACVFTLVDIMSVMHVQPLEMSVATLVSLSSFNSVSTSLTIGGYMAIFCVFRVISVVALATLITGFSELCRSALLALSSTAFLTLAPTLLVSFGFVNFSRIAFLDFLAVTPLAQSSLAYRMLESDWGFFQIFPLGSLMLCTFVLLLAYLWYQKRIRYKYARAKQTK